MLAHQFLEAAGAAPNSSALDEIARKLWIAHGESQLSDPEASAISEAIQARRRAFAAREGFRRPGGAKAASGRPWPARRPPRSPDRQASLERRRRQEASGAMPPRLAAKFTVGEKAVLAVIGWTCQRMQVCVLPIDAIAALAGVCPRLTQNALRLAEQLGLIHIRERRIPGQKSLTNVVTVASKEWRAWLERGRRTIGCKLLHPTDTVLFPPCGKALRRGRASKSSPIYGPGVPERQFSTAGRAKS